jgi:hypothetical protein
MKTYLPHVLTFVLVFALVVGYGEVCEWQANRPEAVAAPEPVRSVDGMAGWLVSGAGDGSYNGAYTEAGTYNGFPAYEIAGGGRFLWAMPEMELIQWFLSESLGGAAAYVSAFDTALPANPWSAVLGTDPAPTVSEYVPPPEEEFIPPTIAITSPLRSELSTAPPWVAGTVDLVCSTVEWGEEYHGLITDDAIEQVTWYTTNHGSPADSVPVTPVETVLSQGGTELLATTLDTTQFTPGSYISIRVQVEYDDTLEGYPAWAPSIVEAETAILVGNPTIAEPLT